MDEWDELRRQVNTPGLQWWRDAEPPPARRRSLDEELALWRRINNALLGLLWWLNTSKEDDMTRRVVMVAVLTAGLLIGLTGRAAAQVRPGDTFKWDQPTSEIANIARFEVRIDDGPFTPVGKVEANDERTQNGHTTFGATVPALTPGSHTFTVRACPATGACGPEAAAHAFTVIVLSAPSNLRIGG